MKPKEIKARLDQLARTLFAASQEMEALLPNFSSEVDQQAARSIITDLHWATENCTVMGLHQIGRALKDTMRAPFRETD